MNARTLLAGLLSMPHVSLGSAFALDEQMLSNPAICPPRQRRPEDPEARDRARAKAAAKRARRLAKRLGRAS